MIARFPVLDASTLTDILANNKLSLLLPEPLRRKRTLRVDSYCGLVINTSTPRCMWHVYLAPNYA